MGKKSTNNGYTVSDVEKYAPTSWGNSTTSDNEPFDYTTSSGQLCLIKKIGMAEILRLGFIDKLDFFSAALNEGDKKTGPSDSEESRREFAKKVLGNFGDLEEAVNAVVLVGVIQPPISALPAPGPTGQVNRVEGVVYVDAIPFEDRVELFDKILDSEGLSDFRKESSPDLGDVSTDESVQVAPV